MILTAMGISMIVPEFVPEAQMALYSAFTIVAMVALYAVFLRMQVGRAQLFLQLQLSQAPQEEWRKAPSAARAGGTVSITHPDHRCRHHWRAGRSHVQDLSTAGLEGTGAPPVLAAIVVAAISAAPEIMTAMRAALANRMQAVVNIAWAPRSRPSS
jgi:Ca2+:H+ antiporter